MLATESPDRPPLRDAADLLHEELCEHRATLEATALSLKGPFLAALDLLELSVRQRGKILLFGNGGSAADAQHIAAELIIRYAADRPPISAIALTTDSSVLTACGNDMGYEAVFARQVEGLGRAGDVAVGISTSGGSANVLRALDQARTTGLRTIGLTGGKGGQMQSLCDVLISVPSPVTARIQEMHIMIAHVLCKALEQRLASAWRV
jgi:D-sedoheptulose 7-phosphate isomerase